MNTHDQISLPGAALALKKLMRILSLTEERELSCDEAFELVDAYLELEEAGENVLGLFPQIAQHLRLCSDCWDEYLALRDCLEQNSGVRTASSVT